MTNQLEVRLIGMSRSGTHALARWIQRQTPGRTCYLNCVEGKQNPFTSARPMDDGSTYETNYEPFDLEAEARGRFSRKDLLLYTLEDSFLAHAASDVFEAEHDRLVGPSARRVDLLLVRDPYNLFASRLRRGVGQMTARSALRVWKQHAREVLGQTRKLRHAPLLVVYNRWVQERAYRAELCARLGIPFTDAGRLEVPGVAGGSSFEGTRFDGRADRMRVLERWKHYADSTEFRELFDAQTIELAEAVCGSPVPELGAWLGAHRASA